MRRLQCLAAMLVLAIGAAAQASGTRTKIVVLDLRAERGRDEGLTELLNELLLTRFQKTGSYEVFGERDIASMVNYEEAGIKLTGCQDDSCLAEIGGALGVDRVVSSNIGQVGDRYLLNMKMLDVKRARVIDRVSEAVEADENSLIEAISDAVKKLVKGSEAVLEAEAVSGIPARTRKLKPGQALGPEDAAPRPTSINLPAWICFGAGIAAAATGGVLGGLALSEKDLQGRAFSSQSEYDDVVEGAERKALAADECVEASPCLVDEDCAAGAACFFSAEDPDDDGALDSVGGRCRQANASAKQVGDECDRATDPCPSNGCLYRSDEHLNRCTEMCMDDGDCPEGYWCQTIQLQIVAEAIEGPISACMPRIPCFEDGECEALEVCGLGGSGRELGCMIEIEGELTEGEACVPGRARAAATSCASDPGGATPSTAARGPAAAPMTATPAISA